MMSGNTGCYQTSVIVFDWSTLAFLSCHFLLQPALSSLKNTVAIRGFRSHCQVLRAPPSLTTDQHPGAAPLLSRVQDSISVFQSHQSLPQKHHSRASLQLCPSCLQGGAHAWARAAPFVLQEPSYQFLLCWPCYCAGIPHPVPQEAAVLHGFLELTLK